MLLFYHICVKEIFKQEKEYPFPRPPTCKVEGCGSKRVWGHGYVQAYFDGYNKVLYLKRYRCEDCGCVYTIKPSGYWPRHHLSALDIFHRLYHKINNGSWIQDITRQRQGNWLRGLKKNIMTYLGMCWSVQNGLYELLSQDKVPVLRSI